MREARSEKELEAGESSWKQRNVRAYINAQLFRRVISVGIPPVQLPRLVGALSARNGSVLKFLSN